MTIDEKIRDEKLQYDINRKAAEISAYLLEILININILQVKKYYLSIINEVIEQAKFTFSHISKVFEKQIKTIEDQGEKHIKAIEDHGKQLVAFNEPTEKDFNINKDSIPLEKQKIYLINLLKKNLLNFRI